MTAPELRERLLVLNLVADELRAITPRPPQVSKALPLIEHAVKWLSTIPEVMETPPASSLKV